jgi:uncharacterized integral membrane protein
VIASLTGLIIFMVQNIQPVTLQFLFWSFTWLRWLFTLAMALVGVGVDCVVRRHRRRKARCEDRRD